MRVRALTAAERHRNGEGWYCCNCGELIGRLADEIERLRAWNFATAAMVPIDSES